MLYVLSPIPPQKTGTADYFELILHDLQSCVEGDDISIVVDSRSAGPEIRTEFFGLSIIDYSNFCPLPSDKLLIFLANNEYHTYCLEEVIRNRSQYICTVIHDPQICMLMAALSTQRTSIFGIPTFRNSLGDSLGLNTDKIVDWLSCLKLPNIALYTLPCQNYSLSNSKVVIVHSYYAALKLQLEHDAYREMPKIIVMQHPEVAPADVLKPASREANFTIGAFGWMSRAKRPDLILSAYEKFMDELSAAERRKISLLFVGQVVPQDYDLVRLCNEHAYTENIVLHDYVEREQFLSLMRNCNLIVNLRYPSCGETSGIFHHARSFRIPIIAPEYQSFFEESSEYRISIDPEFEETELTQALSDAYEKWITKTVKAADVHFPPKLNPESALRDALSVLRH